MAKKRRKSVTCANCGYSFDGIDNYCPNCGQENHSHRAPFKHIFIELIESLTHFDTKFFATVKALFLKPGLLTKDYIEDKRARYVPPVRLYVFVSFIFFFLLSVLSKSDRTSPTSEDPDSRSFPIKIIGQKGIQDTIVAALQKEKSVTDSMIDSLIDLRYPDEGWISTLILRQSIRSEFRLITRDDVNHAFIKSIGIVVFMLMPVFALLLFILQVRHKRLYIEHLIFSVHTHSFIFVILIFALLLYKVTDEDEWSIYLSLSIPIYSTFALRRVYQNSWAKTIFKSLVLTLLYFLCIVLAMSITYLLSFVLI